LKERKLVIMILENTRASEIEIFEPALSKFLKENFPDYRWILTNKRIETLSREDLRRILEAE